MSDHQQLTLVDREDRQWPSGQLSAVTVSMLFAVQAGLPGYSADVVITDPATSEALEWSSHPLAYTVGGWAQAMSLVAWQMERGRHYLDPFS